jgi:hypothetical protein
VPVSRVYCPEGIESEAGCGLDKGNRGLWSRDGTLTGLPANLEGGSEKEPKSARSAQFTTLTDRFAVRPWFDTQDFSARSMKTVSLRCDLTRLHWDSNQS